MQTGYQKISLQQILDAREKRAMRQKELADIYQKPMLCFTMNIAGPVKNSPLIREGFELGIRELELQLGRVKADIVFRETWVEATGNEAFYVIDIHPFLLKQLACELEDAEEAGRLFDMDVLIPDAGPGGGIRKIGRSELGLPERRCLVCGKPARECSSRRIHPVEELVRITQELLYCAVQKETTARIAEYAVRSLLYEVAATPKPGLVDRVNNGSHPDMDFYTFLNSTAALWPYFEHCAVCGFRHRGKDDLPALFACLRLPGKMAENQMLRATGGVNTHKGAVFSLGIVCAAIGYLPREEWGDYEKILSVCAGMTRGLTASDFGSLTMENASTSGQKLYLKYGITGIRGQMEAGLPAVANHGLPLLKKLLSEGKSFDEASYAALLSIMSNMTDTNLIARSDVSTQQQAAGQAGQLVRDFSCPSREAVEALDRAFIEKNLSPGGSADLLAICWMLYFVEQEAAKNV